MGVLLQSLKKEEKSRILLLFMMLMLQTTTIFSQNVTSLLCLLSAKYF